MSSTSSVRQRESMIVPEERTGPEGGAISPELGIFSQLIPYSTFELLEISELL